MNIDSIHFNKYSGKVDDVDDMREASIIEGKINEVEEKLYINPSNRMAVLLLKLDEPDSFYSVLPGVFYAGFLLYTL